MKGFAHTDLSSLKDRFGSLEKGGIELVIDQASKILDQPANESHPLVADLLLFCTTPTYDNFGVELMREFSSRSDLDHYQLALDYVSTSQGMSGTKFPKREYAHKRNFCLTRDGEIIASVGVSPRFFMYREPGLETYEIKGVEGKGAELENIEWEKALVSFALHWCKEVGVPQFGIHSSDSVLNMLGYTNLTRSAAEKRYDKTAETIRFHQRKFVKNDQSIYVMDLS